MPVDIFETSAGCMKQLSQLNLSLCNFHSTTCNNLTKVFFNSSAEPLIKDLKNDLAIRDTQQNKTWNNSACWINKMWANSAEPISGNSFQAPALQIQFLRKKICWLRFFLLKCITFNIFCCTIFAFVCCKSWFMRSELDLATVEKKKQNWQTHGTDLNFSLTLNWISHNLLNFRLFLLHNNCFRGKRKVKAWHKIDLDKLLRRKSLMWWIVHELTICCDELNNSKYSC